MVDHYQRTQSSCYGI